MKKHIFTILAVCAATVSCTGFLTQENPNRTESEFFFQDESSLVLYTNGLVRSYATAIKSFIDGDRYTDAMNWDGSYSYYTDRYTAEDATNWSTSNWSSLRSINYYLENMRKANADPAVLDHYEGVGRFFRAMFYIAKVKTFGAVPWYDHMVDPQNKDDIYMPRTNREEVCRHILEDLDYACEHCSTDASYRNRSSFIHRYVALAIKSRFCLYEGTYRKYHSVDPSTGAPWKSDESRMYLEECIKASEEIMNSRVYELIDVPANRKTQYRDMFTNADGAGNCTKEFIWARDYDLDLNVTNASYSINDYMCNAQHAQYSFNRDFVNTYLMLDGTPYTSKYANYMELELADECRDRDYRLAQTIRTPGFTRAGGTVHYAPDLVYAKTGYQPCKWLTDEINDEISGATATDVPLIRYAEVLLNYAEAKAELGQLDQAAWDRSVKLVRERAGVTSIYPVEADPYLVAYYQNRVTDPCILEVRRERGTEFTMENLRQDDIMRWAQGELLVKQKTGIWIPAIETPLDLDGDGVPDSFVSAEVTEKAGLKVLSIANSGAAHKLSEGDHGYILVATALCAEYSWHDYKYLRPIPASALLENPNLEQNPGWTR